MSDPITLNHLPDDWHLHLRRGERLKAVLQYSANVFVRFLVMPNTDPLPILTADAAIAYKREIKAVPCGQAQFTPLMTIKITPQTTVDIIKDAAKAGVIAGKLYPEGVTTNSSDGVSDFKALYPVFEAMRDSRMVLSIHGELPGASCLDAEAEFLPILKEIAFNFNSLRIVLEHVSTARAVDMINDLSCNVAGTITAHHLRDTIDDVIGTRCCPHHYCKPVAKTKRDREALRAAAVSFSKFFFGSDSAPHPVIYKENDAGAAGVFSALVALPLLAQIFDERGGGSINRLEDFVCNRGADFYGLPKNKGTMTLVKESWKVPADPIQYHDLIPGVEGLVLVRIQHYLAGQELSWKIVP